MNSRKECELEENHIPEEVIICCAGVQKTLTVDGNPHPNKKIAELLTSPNCETLGLMWRTLLSHETVHSKENSATVILDFLRVVDDAYGLPHYHSLPKNKRIKLADDIKDLADDLAAKLEIAGLDGMLIYRSTESFGRAPYEGMTFFVSDSEKCLYPDRYLTEIIREIGNEASSRVKEPRVTGKAVQRVKANNFVRLLATYMQEAYGRPLHTVVLCAAKVLYDEEYSPNDIRKLVRESK